MSQSGEVERKLLKAIFSMNECDFPGCHYRPTSADDYDRHLAKEHPADTWK